MMSLPILCIYTVENYVTIEQPLDCGMIIPFGISMIASILKSKGHNVKFLVMTPNTPLLKTLRPLVESFRPKLVCLTAISTQFPLVSRIAEVIKRLDSKIFLVLGGPHASLTPETTIACPFLDAICVGEGDMAVVALSTQLDEGLDPTGIHNLWIKKRDKTGTEIVEKNSPAPFISDLDRLPFIDWELLRPWISNPERDPAVLLGRGCPFSCSYCSNHALRKLAKGRYVRYRSPGNILEEIEQITKNSNVTAIYLEVETIGFNIEYTMQLCQALAQFNKLRTVPVKFKVNLAITSSLVRDIKKVNQLLTDFRHANIVTINIGLESGSERIRNEVLHRPSYTNDDIILFCNIANKYNIKINLFVMIGVPSETIQDFNQTINVVRRCEPNNIYLSIFYPYPGTDLYEVAKDKGLFDEKTISHVAERYRVYVNLPEFSKRRILVEYIMFEFNVYKGKWPLTTRILYAIRRALLVYPILNNFYFRLSRKTKLFNALYQRYKREF